MGLSYVPNKSPGSTPVISTVPPTPLVVGNVNNMDSSGTIQQFGAITNCINNTISYNSLNGTDYDIVSIKPFNTGSKKDENPIDMYTCYAGNSKTFESQYFVGLNAANIDKCSVSYTDASGNKNPKINQNLKENTVIYKIDNRSLDVSNVIHHGCYARNLPKLGIYNTLPHFIGTLYYVTGLKPDIIVKNALSKVNNYNHAMGTNYDTFGITLNSYDNNNLDLYAGTYGFDAKHALREKANDYKQECNIYYPGVNNFMVFQRKDAIENTCAPKSVTNLNKYNELMTTFMNKNIKQQTKALKDAAKDIDLLGDLFPIRFNVSAIANNKQYSNIAIDKTNSSSKSPGVGLKNGYRTCDLVLTVKEGPPGDPGNKGITGSEGIPTIGEPGYDGEDGYWGSKK
jgi:hypothetical protein